jgi:hypothetical protein
MSSTYSTNLAIELIGTGDQAGNWGSTTNTNLGTLIEQAISGYVTQAITDGADTTITIPNGATGVARNMFIECTGALTAARNLIVPSNKKLYFIYNNTTGGYAVTVKVSGQTGVSVPNGSKIVLVSNGTDVVVATNYMVSPTFTTPTLGTPASGTLTNCTGLPVSTGVSGLGSGVATFLATPSSANLAAALTDETGTGANVFATSPTLVTPNLGTPSAATLTNATGLPLTTGVTGTLPVANGGTGATSITSGSLVKGNGTSAFSAASASDIVTAIGSTAVTNATNATNATNLTGSGTISSTTTATTQAAGTNNTTIATTAFVTTGLQAAYPVGSIYMSTVSTNPATLFGFGTWVAYGQGRMPISQDGSTYIAGATGGSATTTLVTANLPSHNHTATSTVTDPGHFHSGGATFPIGRADGADTAASATNTGTATTGITVSTTIGNTGSGTAVTTISPYIAVYMWTRTA